MASGVSWGALLALAANVPCLTRELNECGIALQMPLGRQVAGLVESGASLTAPVRSLNDLSTNPLGQFRLNSTTAMAERCLFIWICLF